jgi:hypothetical protein
MKDLPPIEEIDMEWVAWRSFCHEFRDATGIKIDNDDLSKMVAAAARWGEELVELRKKSPLDEKALAEIRSRSPFHPNASKRESS